MKRLLVVTAALSLMLPALAQAQNNEHKGPPGGHAPAAHPAARPAARPAPHRAARPMARPAARPMARPAARPMARPGHPVAHPARRGPGRAGNRPLPARGNQFYHRGHAFNRVHAAPFVYPHGWHYRRWSIGGVLPRIFWSPTYYYNDWAGLGLQAPAPGYEWVRFGPDLLLVNITTGQIEDVVYGVFL